MFKWVLLSLMLLLTACSSSYQDANSPLNITGGYGSEAAPGDLIKVYFAGNGYTSVKQAQAYVLRRAAEVGREKQEPYFAVYQSITDAVDNNKSVAPAFDDGLGKPYAYAYIQFHTKKEPGDFTVTDIQVTPKK